MIPHFKLILLFIFLSLIAFILMEDRSSKHRAIRSFLVVPFFVNLLLTLNYLLSFNPTVESYRYEFNYQIVKASGSSAQRQRSTLITLSDDKYDAYPGIRMFWDFDKMKSGNRITYTFCKGFLGIDVMTDYKFG